MTTEHLIAALAKNVAPVRVVAPVGRRFAVWLAWSLAATAFAIWLRHPRADIGTALASPRYLAELVATLLVGMLASVAALRLAVPGRERVGLVRWGAVAAGLGWAALVTGSLIAGGRPFADLQLEPATPACVAKLVLVGALPALILFGQLRNAAPLRLGWSAGLAALGALGLGAAGAQILCPFDQPAHLWLWHVLPFAGLAALAVGMARPLLTWGAQGPHR